MKKFNSSTLLLFLGVALCIFSSFILGNLILGILVFAVILGMVIYNKRALLISASADTAFKKNDLAKTFELYEKAIAIKNCPPMVKIIYAYRLIHTGNAEGCAKVIATLDPEKMTKNEKFNYDATRALSIWKQGDITEAIRIFEAVASQKESLLIYETLGYLLICSRDYEKALEFNLKAYEFSQTDLIKDNLAASYYYLGEFKKASKLYKELIENHATFPEPYYYYALILNEREKYKAALKYLRLGLDKKESHLSELKHSSLQYMIDQIEDYLAYLEAEKAAKVESELEVDTIEESVLDESVETCEIESTDVTLDV